MNFLKFCLAPIVTFILGAMLFHTLAVKANPQAADLVHVYIYPVLIPDAKTPFPQNIPGGRIAGISCIPKPGKNTPDSVICYVATTLN